mmetsp:Transcript_31592/g.46303  ORF Transcript_31592/g.46303 Transcript_31592/m.46303 type:complete len:923 (-) Transcript_31592:762-3530(-)
MPGGHHHRAGGLRQSNKRNKRSNASKRSKTRSAGGKLAGGGGGGGTKRAGIKNNHAASIRGGRMERLNAAKQRREMKKEAKLAERRAGGAAGAGGSGSDAPRVVGIISLSEGEADVEERVRDFVLSGADKTTLGIDGKKLGSITAKYPTHGRDGLLSFVTNSAAFRPQYDDSEGSGNKVLTGQSTEDASVSAALDLCRVCDLIVFVLDASSSTPSPLESGMSVGGISHNTNSTKLNPEDLISSRGERVLTAVKSQGLPSVLTLLVHSESADGEGDDEDDGTMSLISQSDKSMRRSAIRRRAELKRFTARFASTEFGEDVRTAEVDLNSNIEEEHEDEMAQEDTMEEDHKSVNTSLTHTTMSTSRSKKLIPIIKPPHPSASLVRILCTIHAKPPRWVADAPRPYLVTDPSSAEKGECGHVYDRSKQELQLTGYIRGHIPWDVNSLVHIPNLGTFGVKRVEKATAPLTSARNRDTSSMEQESEVQVVDVDHSIRESLQMFATPDALEGEQNLIGFDEDREYDEDDIDNDADDKGFQKGESRPTGWSDYQSAWLDAIDLDGEEDEVDHGELAFALNKKSDSASVAAAGMLDLDEANDVTPEERRALLEQRRKGRKEDLEFPDEVEVQDDVKASDRFARYRSLKSFRRSHWDPKENLPDSYGNIYHFQSFKSTQRDVMADMKDVMDAAAEAMSPGGRWSKEHNKQKNEDSMDDRDMTDSSDEDEDLLEGHLPSGVYVTITVESVPPSSYDCISPSALLAVVSLLPHENKVSVMHAGLSQTPNCEMPPSDPIKSKDVLTIRCGWRTWRCRPVFSQNNLNSDKHKFERYMPTDGAHFAASFFGPVTYAPCPVLVFREAGPERNARQLVAVGSVLGADAERIVVKRIILTGFPVRVHKRHATVKYMFYNPDDVMVRDIACFNDFLPFSF